METLVNLAMEISQGQFDRAKEWLQLQGCTILSAREGEFTVKGRTGMVIGILATDPIMCGVQLGFAMHGVFWPQVYPDLLKEINKLWKSNLKVLKAGGGSDGGKSI